MLLKNVKLPNTDHSSLTQHFDISLASNLFINSIPQESSAKAEETALNAEFDSSSSSSSNSSDSEKDENEDEFDEKDVEKLNSLMSSVSMIIIYFVLVKSS